MSNLLSQASLVMIPSGYKEDVVYSPVPTDGSGDLSFTRASNGTRVNSAGLVEVCPWNNITNSEKFGNGYWANFGGTITDDSVVAPNGTTTAATYSGSPAGTYKTFSGYQNGQVLTISCYAKLGTATNVVLVANNSNAWDTIGGKSFTSADGLNTTTWTRIEYSFTAVVFSGSWNWHIGSHSQTGLTPQSNGTFYIWGAQLNIGSTAKPYFPTTDRLNVPRLTYQNGGGGCPSLLLEKQSTNLVLYSQDFTQSGQWLTLDNAVVSSTKVTSPDGTQNANQAIYDGTANCRVEQVIGGVTSGADYTFSVYMRVASGTANVEIGHGASTVAQTVTTTWQRFSVTQIPIAGTSYPRIMCNSAKTVEVWGAQLEASSYATSYIPTTSSSATRVADACYKTGISSLIGQTEGTLFFDIDKLIDESKLEGVFYVSDGTSTTNVISFYFAFSNQMVCSVVESGATQAQFTIGTITTRTKIALAYKANDFALYKNGSLVGTDTSGSVPALNKLTLGATQSGTAPMTGIFNQAILFPTRLTNAELASLTTL